MSIRVLSPEVASRIAAGEVVERPASAVKELIENSLDAGADEVRVEVREGGRRLLRVIDNGQGIPAADALLAFERHATSKLTEADDLEHIRTLGFRGEALASIASVSQVTMLTRHAGEPVGTSGAHRRRAPGHAGAEGRPARHDHQRRTPFLQRARPLEVPAPGGD